MIKFLTWFFWLWAGAVIALNIIGTIGMILGAPTLTDAWLRVTDTYSPFNLWTHGLNVVLLLPAIGAVYWWKALERRLSR